MSGGEGLWLAFALFLALLVGGVAVAGVTLVSWWRDVPGRARRAEPSALVLGDWRVPRRGVVALVLVTVGLTGSVGTGVAAAMAHGGMMGGGMMGSGIMMGAPRGGQSPPAVVGAPTVTVTATEFGFDPGRLRLRAGETVNLALDNRGEAFHTLTISALDFELRAEGETTATGALTVARRGTFAFVCAVPGHEHAGMRGTLVVE